VTASLSVVAPVDGAGKALPAKAKEPVDGAKGQGQCAVYCVGMWMDRDKQASHQRDRHQGFVHAKLQLEVQGPSGMRCSSNVRNKSCNTPRVHRTPASGTYPTDTDIDTVLLLVLFKWTGARGGTDKPVRRYLQVQSCTFLLCSNFELCSSSTRRSAG
jgi:hypothetical protein